MKDWKTVKDTLKKESGIQVHFSDAYNTVTIGANSNTSKKWHKYFSESQSPKHARNKLSKSYSMKYVYKLSGKNVNLNPQKYQAMKCKPKQSHLKHHV